jgi:cytochrome c-type biogenesis protein CcmH/NrfG
VISRDYPQGFYNTGVLFATTNQHDSSAYYFKLAIEKAGADPRFVKDKLNATLNLASMYQALGKHAEAVVEFRTFLAAEPNDLEAKRAMASSLRLSGQAEEAGKIESAMLASAIADGTATASELMVIGVGLFQDKKYAEAGDAFGKALEKEPFNRDARFNLANVYLAQKNGPKLVETGQALVAMEPLNTINVKLVAEGHRADNDQEKLLAEVVKVMAMPTTMTVDSFRIRKDGARVTATAKGLDATTVDGKPLPAAAKTINFEFINAAGAVVVSTEVAIPALKAGESHPIEIDLKGAEIAGWRYTVK